MEDYVKNQNLHGAWASISSRAIYKTVKDGNTGRAPKDGNVVLFFKRK